MIPSASPSGSQTSPMPSLVRVVLVGVGTVRAVVVAVGDPVAVGVNEGIDPMATPCGAVPDADGGDSVLVAVAITDTVSASSWATSARAPSGVTATPVGLNPRR